MSQVDTDYDQEQGEANGYADDQKKSFPKLGDSMPPILEERVVKVLESNVSEADLFEGSDVGTQRERNHTYFAMGALGNEKEGRSQHVSSDVLDAVQSQKAFYLEAFLSGRRPVRFKPENPGDMGARLATEYVTQQFLEENPGIDLLRDSLHDALVAKRCVMQIEWRTHFDETRQGYTDLTNEQVDLLLAEDDVQGLSEPPVPKKTPNPQTGDEILTFSGGVVRKTDLSYCDSTPIKPERFYRDPNASYITSANYAGHWEDNSRAEFINRGFDPKEIMDIRLDYRFQRNEEDAARKRHDQSWVRRNMNRQPEAQEVTLYTTYVYMDLTPFREGGDGGKQDELPPKVCLYKFYWSGGKLLTNPETGEKYQEIDDGMPFVEWTQIKISHSETGLCEADVQADVQWNKSNMRRLIVDNIAMVNTSRWKARHSFVKNPRELLDNNIGSIIWLKDMAALEPLETPQVSPQTYQVIEQFDEEKENRGGLSRLAKGMSGDAISHQNADTMIQRLTNASNRRVLMGVRDYAECFLKPMYNRIYNLGVRHDSRERMIEIAGLQFMVCPKQWMPRTKMFVQVALTPDEGREEATFLMGMHDKLAADPDLAVLYTIEKKYTLFQDIFDNMGHADSARYMLHPASTQAKQQMQQRQKMEQMQQLVAQQNAELLRLQGTLMTQEQMRKQAKTKADIANIATDNMRMDDELAHEIALDGAQLALDTKEVKNDAAEAAMSDR